MTNPLIDRAFEDDLPDPDDLPVDAPSEERAAIAVGIAVQFGYIDGDHHKMWVIDQMTRALLGPDYDAFVARFCAGEDGPDTYSWDEGIAP